MSKPIVCYSTLKMKKISSLFALQSYNGFFTLSSKMLFNINWSKCHYCCSICLCVLTNVDFRRFLCQIVSNET